jgi:predicted transglutaminase-like cysteine proteinase
MKSLSGARIALAAVAVCVALALSLAVHHGASGAVTTSSMPSRQTPTRPGAATSVRPAPGAEQITIPPAGFINFQMRYPEEVRETAPAYATEAQIETAHDANTKINRQIVWRETRLWSVELEPRAQGDCVQYALTKRHVLREACVPDGAFRVVILYAAKYEGLHMVLEMRTPGEIYVLDSLENDARHHFYTVAQMPPSYAVVKYQAWGKPTQWMAPSALVAETSRAMRRLHDEVAVADSEPWVSSPVARAHGLHHATASREPGR